MKHFYFTFLLVVLMSMTKNKAFAYDIAVENEDGVTIYYNYINDGKELEVTAPVYNREMDGHTHYYTTAYKGVEILRIPSEVTYMGRTDEKSHRNWRLHICKLTENT